MLQQDTLILFQISPEVYVVVVVVIIIVTITIIIAVHHVPFFMCSKR